MPGRAAPQRGGVIPGNDPCFCPSPRRYFAEMGEATPTREHPSRAALRASLLFMMLISVSAEASRGVGEMAHTARAALQSRLINEHLLPARTHAGLVRCIRFAAPEEPATARSCGDGRPTGGEAPTMPRPRMLAHALIDLPPPGA